MVSLHVGQIEYGHRVVTVIGMDLDVHNRGRDIGLVRSVTATGAWAWT